MDKWKKIVLVIIVITIIGIIIKISLKNNYKNLETGNNKSIQEIEQYLLNINSYKAKIEVTVKSNKNENKYVIKQEVKNNEFAKQITTEPKEIENLEISYENGQIQIKNNQLELNKIYKNYPYITENQLFLTDFIEEYRTAENKAINEKENEIIVQYKSNKNKYNVNKKLYLNKEKLKPEKIEITDMNNECKVYILYDEIELNI